MANECPKCQTNNPNESKFCMECATPLPGIKETVHTKTLETPTEELKRGSVFAGRYEIIEELGRGGMGKVYRVEDTKIKEEMALKLIKPEIASDKKTIERFSNELKLARKITHENVCRMYDLNEYQGIHFITMEYVSGGDLKSLIRRTKRLDTRTAVSITKQICEGLIVAHSLGIVHRDLKSNNIMIDKNGNARIMDFGIARSLEAKGITGSGVMIGTPEYMSPEQVEGEEVDQRSDIYSLGVILYEMVTGKLPFEGDTPFAVGVKHKSEIPKKPKELNSQIPDQLNGLIMRCLEKDKEARYSNVGDLFEDLNSIEKGIPVVFNATLPKKTLTSREVTLKFDLKTMIIPLLSGIVIIILTWFFFFRGKGISLDPNLVLLTVFENQTGIADLDPHGRVAADSLAEGIAQMQGLDVIPISAALERFQSRMEKKAGIQDVVQIQEIGKKTGAGLVVSGSYFMTGQEIQFNAKITNTQTGKLISSVSTDFGISEKTNIAMADYRGIILKLRQRVMGVLASRQELFLSEILSLRPPTYDAYQEYRLGWEYFERDYDQSIQHFSRAHEMDPSFIWPLHVIAMIHSNQGDFPAAWAYANKIDQMRESITEYDRYVLDFRFAYLERNIEKGLSILHQAEKKFPKSYYILDTIGLLALQINRPQEALAALSKSDIEAAAKMTIVPSTYSINRMIQAYHMLGDYVSEQETINRAKKLFPDRNWRTSEVRVLSALGKTEDVQRFVDESLEGLAKSGSPRNVLFEAIRELRVHGLTAEAQNIASSLVDWSQKQMPVDPSETQLRQHAGILYLAQQWNDAYDIYSKLADNHPDSDYNIDYITSLACISARRGLTEEAIKIFKELGTINSQYIFGRQTYCQARIASLIGKKQQAVDLLNKAIREGFAFTNQIKQDQDFLPLLDFPPFQEFLKPKG